MVFYRCLGFLHMFSIFIINASAQLLCLYCLLVLDYTHLYRSIYLRGIALGGLPMIFYQQLVRQVGACVLFPCQTRWYVLQALRPSNSSARSSRSDRSPGSSTLMESDRSPGSILRRSPQHLRLQIQSQNRLRGRLC